MTALHPSRTTHYAPRIALLVVVLLAAYLRLNHLEWTEFKLDEAHLSQLAYDMARHGQIPLVGLGSSVGIANAPLSAWLLAIPFAVSSDPIVATGFIAALDVLAVFACYGLARRLFASFGERAVWAALVATLLFAVSPWAVIHSRKIWAQDLLPPVVMLWAWFGYRAFVAGKRWSLIGHGVMLAAAIQLHYSGLYLIPVSVVWLLAFLKRTHWQPVVLTGLLCVAAFTPFLIADAMRGWPTVSGLVAILEEPVIVDGEALHFAWVTTTGEEIHSLAGPQEFENYRAQIIPADGLLLLEGILVLGGLMLALVDAARSLINRAWSSRGAIGWFLAAWLSVPIVTQIVHRTPVYPHYFIILYPAQFLLIGWLIAHLPKWPRVIVIAAVLAVSFVQVQHGLVLQSFLASRPTPGGSGMPIAYTDAVVREARQAMHDRSAAEIVVNTRGIDPAVDEYPAVFSFLLSDTPHRIVDVTQAARLYPNDANIQIDFLPDEVTPRPTADREPIGRVALRTGEQAADIYAVAPYASLTFDPQSTPLARWANGVGVMWLKARQARPGQTALIDLYARVDNVPMSATYQWTNQLFDAQGKRWAQVDTGGYPAGKWRVGDIIGYEFSLQLPADLPYGDYVLRIGQYTLPEVATVPVIDAAGLPQSDAVEYQVSVEP